MGQAQPAIVMPPRKTNPARRWRPSLRVRLLAAPLVAFLACPSIAGPPGDEPRPVSPNATARASGSAALAEDPPSELENLIRRYTADRESLTRYYRIPLSDQDEKRMRQFYKSWCDRLADLEFDALGRPGQVDYILLANQLDYESRDLEQEAKRNETIAPYMPFAKTIVALEEARRRGEDVDPERAAETLAKLAEEVDSQRKKPGSRGDGDAPKLKKSEALRAAREVENLRSSLRRWYGFYNGYDPVFTWWVKAPYKQADGALERYTSTIRGQIAGVREGDRDTINGDPIGHDGLASDLKHEMITYSPEDLLALAEREFAWCDAEMRKASNELGYGDDWKKALEHVKNKHVEPGKQPELIRELALEAMRFLDEHDLVTVPELCRETWRVEMMSVERQRVNPFFTGGEVISVSYPTDEMSHEEKLMSMRGNNIHFSRATVHHELIPGHHLQGFMGARHRTYRRIFHTPFWTEGWALYWEMLLWDMGFPKTPEDRIGMLFWRSHRCARIVFSLKFHLEQMTPQEAIDFLVDRVGHERSNATAEVRRSFDGSYSPLYQCAYMLGGLQIRGLHAELVESGKLTNRQFHDAALRENGIPIEMIRASMTDQPLTRDYKAQWKFAGALPENKAAESR